MAHKKIAAFLLFSILALSLPMFGQYDDKITLGLRDNPATDCTGSANCWQSLGLGSASIAVAQDGTLIAVGSADHHIYRYDQPSSTWLDMSASAGGSGGANLGGIAKAVAAGDDANNFFAITTETSNNIYRTVPYGGSFKWIHFGNAQYCPDSVAAGGSNYLWCLNGGHAYKYNATFGTWTQTTPSALLWAIAVDPSNGVIAWGRDGNFWGYNGTTWTNHAHPLGFAPYNAPGGIGVSEDGTIIIVDNTGGTRLSRDYGATFTKVTGQVTNGFAATSGRGQIFVGASSNIYHYTGTMPTETSGFTGVVHCMMDDDLPCPPGTLHHATTSITFPHGMKGTPGDGDFNPNLSPPQTSIDYSSWCDPAYKQNTMAAECQATYDGVATCPHMGTLFSELNLLVGWFPHFKWFFQKYEYFSTAGGPFPLWWGGSYYNYIVQPYCITQPNAWFGTLKVAGADPGPFFYVQMLGFGTDLTGYKIVAIHARANQDPSLFPCDNIPGGIIP